MSIQSQGSIRGKIQRLLNWTDIQSGKGLAAFLNSVIIACEPTPRRFGDCAEPWQRNEIIAPKIGAMEWLAGLNPGYTGPRSFLDVLPRGHDKSSLEGRLATWLLCYSKRPIAGYIVAEDREQAALILDAMQVEARLNPWIDRKLTFVRNTVTGPRGTLQALPADAASAYGLRGNLYICDEFTHWKNDLMWQAVVSGREKRESLLLVISNAGLLNSWQDRVRHTACDDPSEWVVFEAEGQLASWMTKERVDKVRKLLPPSVARRVLDNKWIDPTEEADYLRREEVEGCISATLSRALSANPKYKYVLAWDYGRVNDRSVGVIGHEDEKGVCVVDAMDVFAGSHERPVEISEVEQWIDRQIEIFKPRALIFDPYQMEGTMQKLERKGKNVIRFTGRQTQPNMELAMALRNRITNGRLLWYPGCGDLIGGEDMVTELASLRVKQTPYGYRFDHTADMHDDRAVALGMLALYCSEYPAIQPTINVAPIVIPQPKHDFWGTGS